MSRLMLLPAFLCFALSSAFSQISVTSPANGSSVNPPVWVRASVSSCNGSASTSFGYSIDDSSSITWGATANDIDNTDSTIGPGTHIIRFKAWSNNGQCPEVDSTITVYQSGITVTSPTNNSSVNSPVWIRAHVSNCNDAVSTSFGYSVDDNTSITWGVTVNDIDTTDSSVPAGAHVIRFKAWSNNGQCPEVDRTVTVTNPDGITVTSPAQNATTILPVAIKASVGSCNGSASTSFGYSVDDNTSITWGSATSLDVQDSSIPVGSHTIRFKAWSNAGQCPEIDRSITVNSSGAITVNSPADNSTVNSPVWINGSVTSCNGSPSTNFGYSVDDSTGITWGTATAIDTNDATIQPGTHIIRFKAWSNNGQCAEVDRNITVNAPSSGGGSNLAPSGAASTSEIEENLNYTNGQRNHPDQGHWGWEQDGGVHDGSGKTGCSDNQWIDDTAQTCAVDSTSSTDGTTRSFTFNWLNTNGAWTGERWHITPTLDTSHTYYVYDTYINVPDPTLLWEIEMDTNVTIGGQTYLFGVECDYGDQVWKITNSSGWADSGAACTRDLLPTGWHRVQVQYHISSGRLVYDMAKIDNNAPEVFTNTDGGPPRGLGWADGVLLNFQLNNDGTTHPSGSTTVQLDHMTIWRWN